MLTLKPSALTTFLTAAFTARRSVLITGAPGIGKTDIVHDAATRCGADVIVSHPAVADPTDAKGLPFVVDGHATFLPFGDLRRAIEATKPTIWFLDDLGQAPPSVQASYMQLLLARRLNEHVLSDNVTFVAATNRRTDKAAVSGILEPVKSRFTSIVELAVDLDDWCAWAMRSDMPAELIAFLRFRSDLLCKFEASADLTNSPVPRTWSNVAKLMALPLPSDVMHIAIAGAVGEGAATEFAGFRRLFAQLPNIDKILADPERADVPTRPEVLYAVATALGMRTDKDNFPKVARYIQKLADARHGEFATLLIRDAVRRNKDKGVDLTNTAAFVKLATSDLGHLITGSF